MPLSLYIHIPFCQRKCPYCDFNTYAGLNRLFKPYVAALVKEIRAAGAARSPAQVKTVFLGGGTPTVLPVELLGQILDACRTAFDLLPDAETTSEANPGTVDVSRFSALRQMGVNRLSMGVQSFDPAELDFLGRIHSADEAAEAFHAARAAGFDNINLDLIYGLPQQSPGSWQQTLQRAIDLGPEHIATYSLTIEDGTPFAEWAAAGRFSYPDPDLAADLYEAADQVLCSAGYVQYEISNWARGLKSGGHEVPQLRSNPPTSPAPLSCRHNLTYWRNEPYLGFGPGAHSSEDGRRWAAINPVAEYVDRVAAGVSTVAFEETIDERLAMGETMLLGLRLVQEGVTYERFEQRHGRAMPDVFGEQIDSLESLGLLERLSDRIRLAPWARLVANQVFLRFLP